MDELAETRSINHGGEGNACDSFWSKLRKHLPEILFWVCLFALLLFFHGFYSFLGGDDAWYYNVMSQTGMENIWSFAVFRYYNWTSRVLYEILGCYFVFNCALFLFLDLIIQMLAIWCLSRLVKGGGVLHLLVAAALYLMIPSVFYFDAGYIMTSLNYSWAVSACLLALVPLIDNLRGERVRWLDYVLGVLGLVYVAFCEMLTICVAIVSLIALIRSFQKKHLFAYSIVALVIGIGGTINFLVCPGENARLGAETTTWFPEFASFTVFDKAGEGFVFLAQSLFQTPFLTSTTKNNAAFDLFVILTCCYCLFISRKRAGIITSCSCLVFTFLEQYYFARVSKDPYHGVLNDFSLVLPWDNILFQFFVILSLLCILCLFYSVLSAFGFHCKTGWIIVGIVSLGMGMKLGIGFSPTVIASGTRMTLFLYIPLLIADFVLIEEIVTARPETRNVLLVVILSLGLFLYFNSFFSWYSVNPDSNGYFRLFPFSLF
jgi:hypothetical protein